MSCAHVKDRADQWEGNQMARKNTDEILGAVGGFSTGLLLLVGREQAVLASAIESANRHSSCAIPK